MKFGLIMLASGFGRRFGSNKLLIDFNGQPLYTVTLDKLEKLKMRDDVLSLVVVTQYDEIVQELQSRGVDCIINDHAEEGISSSFRLGISKILEICKPDAIVSFVADQPYMKFETYEGALDTFVKLNSESHRIFHQNEESNTGIITTSSEVQSEYNLSSECYLETNSGNDTGRVGNGYILACTDGIHRGNPVIFDSIYIPELMQLTGDEGGKQIIKRHMDKLCTFTVDSEELEDIDVPQMLQK